MAEDLVQTAQGYSEENGDAGFSITASEVLEHLFCPRFTYFELYLNIPEHQEKRFKVQQGRTVHEDKASINPRYLRQKLGCTSRKSRVYIGSQRGIRGVVDEILFMEDGSAAPLDFKYAEYKERTFKNHTYQLTFYGQLIKDHYGVPVNRGFIVYTRSRNKLVEVAITEEMYAELHGILKDILDIVRRGVYPQATSVKARCPDCCYGNICEKQI